MVHPTHFPAGCPGTITTSSPPLTASSPPQLCVPERIHLPDPSLVTDSFPPPVPSETLFYSVLGVDKPYSPSGKPIDVLAAVEGKLKDFGNLMQIGADATTGLGWCSVALKDKKEVK